MQNHKYRVGQRVNFVGPSYLRGASASYEVVRLLPPESGQCLYRVKNALELHERVFAEEQLAAEGRAE
jgi:hypothetical protein